MDHQPDGGSRGPGTSRTPCPLCAATDVMLGTLTGRFVYLRCRACYEVWSIPERRASVRRAVQKAVGVVKNDVQPL
jgi:hypothetical protein